MYSHIHQPTKKVNFLPPRNKQLLSSLLNPLTQNLSLQRAIFGKVSKDFFYSPEFLAIIAAYLNRCLERTGNSAKNPVEQIEAITPADIQKIQTTEQEVTRQPRSPIEGAAASVENEASASSSANGQTMMAQESGKVTPEPIESKAKTLTDLLCKKFPGFVPIYEVGGSDQKDRTIRLLFSAGYYAEANKIYLMIRIKNFLTQHGHSYSSHIRLYQNNSYVDIRNELDFVDLLIQELQKEQPQVSHGFGSFTSLFQQQPRKLEPNKQGLATFFNLLKKELEDIAEVLPKPTPSSLVNLLNTLSGDLGKIPPVRIGSALDELIASIKNPALNCGDRVKEKILRTLHEYQKQCCGDMSGEINQSAATAPDPSGVVIRKRSADFI